MGNRSGLKRSQKLDRGQSHEAHAPAHPRNPEIDGKENACVTVRCKSAPAARSPTKSDSSHGLATSVAPAARSPTKSDASHGLATSVEEVASTDTLGDTGASSDCILRPASWGPIRVPNLNGPTHLALRGTELIISNTLGHAVHCVPLADVGAHPHAVHPYPGQWHHFLFPTGVACDESGRCWVAECNKCTVSLCSLPKPSDGPWSTLASTGPPATSQGVLGCFGSEGSGEGQLRGPDGLALHRPSQSLLVVDQANHRVSAFDVTSTPPALKFSFGQHGSGDGELSQPRGIACDDGDEGFVCGAISAVARPRAPQPALHHFGPFLPPPAATPNLCRRPTTLYVLRCPLRR